MKKLLAFAAAAAVSLSAFAQDNLKNLYVGGSLGVWRNQSDKVTSVTIAPEVGYNLNDTWSVGAQIGYRYLGNSSAKNSSFIFDPYARWTYLRAGMVQLFVDGGVDFSLGHTSWEGDDSDVSASFGIGLKPGVALNLNKNFSIIAHFGFLGYQGANKAAEVGGFKKGFGFDFNNSVNFGFYYTF
ncbi:MAG: porin family protein [Muribaculaceae bacterium]|nr:porin family protein [Muribaculaceae bacterium]